MTPRASHLIDRALIMNQSKRMMDIAVYRIVGPEILSKIFSRLMLQLVRSHGVIGKSD